MALCNTGYLTTQIIIPSGGHFHLSSLRMAWAGIRKANALAWNRGNLGKEYHKPITYNIKTTLRSHQNSCECLKTPQDRYAVVSGTKTLAADPLSLVSCKVGPSWIRLFVQHIPTDAWSNWDLGNLETRSTPWTLCFLNHSRTISAV